MYEYDRGMNNSDSQPEFWNADSIEGDDSRKDRESPALRDQQGDNDHSFEVQMGQFESKEHQYE